MYCPELDIAQGPEKLYPCNKKLEPPLDDINVEVNIYFPSPDIAVYVCDVYVPNLLNTGAFVFKVITFPPRRILLPVNALFIVKPMYKIDVYIIILCANKNTNVLSSLLLLRI
jgi:hypothetical protein